MDFLTSTFFNFNTEDNIRLKSEEDFSGQNSLLSLQNTYSEDFNYEINQYYYLEPAEIKMMPISDIIVEDTNSKIKINKKSNNTQSKKFSSKEDTTNSTFIETPYLELDEESQVLSDKSSHESFLYKKRNLSSNLKGKKEKCKIFIF